MSFFNNKVVAITGGTDGIGRALVNAFIEAGARVATCGRNHDKLYTLQLEHSNVELHAITCDVSKETDCKRFIDSTIKTFGGIDILINNAGISMRSLFRDADMEVLRRVMDINFYGAVYCTRYALPALLESKGVVVGVSSIAGYRGLPGRSAYSASKFALQGWLEALRVELLQTGVHVMWVCPGFTASNIRKVALNSQGQPQGESPLEEDKLMQAPEVAAAIMKSIEHRKRTLVISFTGKRTIFMNRFFPSLTDKMVYKFFFKDDQLTK